MKSILRLLMVLCLSSTSIISLNSQSKNSSEQENPYDGLELRSIGPAFMSGRIAAIAIHPTNENIWYVAVGSGGVWKTTNSGTTWTPVFDDQASYSIGAVSIDPNNPQTIWVGTGEDVGGRHVGFGDGVYKSEDGGKTWENMGLKDTQHISRVIVHPEDSNTIWVTAQGPLWNKGGERGLYKSTNGGKSWKKTLGDEEWTGVTDLVYDPRNPDRMYAATWQRHRTVAAYFGNGPGTALYRSNDGGSSWEKLENGLPKSGMGKIGLAISPHNPDIIYAAIELDRRTGGVFRSDDGGSHWTKQSDAVAGATGPHYYQELFACPHHENRLYLMDSHMQISDDGGKTFYRMNNNNKHGDNHAIAFKKSDPNYLLVGTDGGLYESFDLTKSWKYIANLPVTQFYKLAVDDATPFYNIYGGTQDNSTERGPSRTDNIHGIQNSDWRVVLNWDGHQPATEPGNPDIVYAERQEGTLSRLDMKTGEVIDIQPQPELGEVPERFNWDAPILVSPHNPSTIYFASQRVWKSDNRGDKWTTVSDDLTKNQERITLPIMGKQQSWDGAWDFYAMSNYNTITSLAESPAQKGLLYAGTDDGLINISEDGGANWRQIEVNRLPGVPETAFVNDIKADLFDASTVYVALDNHKYGDFKPYLFKSNNKGKSWVSISEGIPDKHLVWRLVQDHINPNLLFIGTEYGLFFTLNGGKAWTKLKGKVPTISFRDLVIQKRENDLVAASFGRGFYILDDYSALRELPQEGLPEESKLFPVKDALWYIERSQLSFEPNKGSQGDAHFVAPNPEFGATFTYYMDEVPELIKDTRQKNEEKNPNDIPFPGWESLEAEKLETLPQVWFTIKNNYGEVVRHLAIKAEKGIHRMTWDLRYATKDAILLNETSQISDQINASGLLVAPGDYNVTMYLNNHGELTQLGSPESFSVKPLYEGTLRGNSQEAISEFWRAYEDCIRKVSAVDLGLNKAQDKTKALKKAILRSSTNANANLKKLQNINDKVNQLKTDFMGNSAKLEVGEKNPPTINDRMFAVYRGLEKSTYGPTESHKRQLEIVKEVTANLRNSLDSIAREIENLESQLKNSGAPYVEN